MCHFAVPRRLSGLFGLTLQDHIQVQSNQNSQLVRSKAIYSLLLCRYVELKHPVYGLLFQFVLIQVAVLCILVLSLLVWVFLLALDINLWVRMASIASVSVRQMYEVTWACVTHLRYFHSY